MAGGKKKGLYEFTPRAPRADLRQVETLLDLGGIDLMATESAAKIKAEEASTLVPTENLFETIPSPGRYEVNQEGIIPGSAIKHDVALTKEETAEPGPLLQKKYKKLSKTADEFEPDVFKHLVVQLQNAYGDPRGQRWNLIEDMITAKGRDRNLYRRGELEAKISNEPKRGWNIQWVKPAEERVGEAAKLMRLKLKNSYEGKIDEYTKKKETDPEWFNQFLDKDLNPYKSVEDLVNAEFLHSSRMEHTNKLLSELKEQGWPTDLIKDPLKMVQSAMADLVGKQDKNFRPWNNLQTQRTAQKKLIEFLNQDVPNTKLKNKDVYTNADLARMEEYHPLSKDLDMSKESAIQSLGTYIGNFRKEMGLEQSKDFKPLQLKGAVSKFKTRLKNYVKDKKGIELDSLALDAYAENARILLSSSEHGLVQTRTKAEGYTDSAIDTAVNFIYDTDFRYGDPREINSYVIQREKAKRMKETLDHMRDEAATTPYFSGMETAIIKSVPWPLNRKHKALWNQLKVAEKSGDVAEIARIEKKMEDLGIRSSRILPLELSEKERGEIEQVLKVKMPKGTETAERLGITGEQQFFGAPAGEGKMKTGGMVKNDVQSSLVSVDEVLNGIY